MPYLRVSQIRNGKNVIQEISVDWQGDPGTWHFYCRIKNCVCKIGEGK